MKQYYLGVDIGGTKSHALLSDDCGNVIALGTSGAANHQSVGYEQMVNVMRDIIEQTLSISGIKIDQIAGAGFGIAGFDWMSEKAMMLSSIAKTGLTCPVEVVNDTLIGLLAGASGGWGVAVVSGTGCNCWGWDKQRNIGRVTGYGMRMAEGAGGEELVEKAIQAVSLEWSRRGQPTALSQELMKVCGAKDLSALMEGLCLGSYDFDAALAPLVFKCAKAGDMASREIINWAGQQLGNMAIGVIHQLGFESLEFEVILVGSMYDGGSLLIDPMTVLIHSIAKHAKLIRLNTLPAVGGVLLGMDTAGKRQPEVRNNLIETTDRQYLK